MANKGKKKGFLVLWFVLMILRLAAAAEYWWAGYFYPCNFVLGTVTSRFEVSS